MQESVNPHRILGVIKEAVRGDSKYLCCLIDGVLLCHKCTKRKWKYIVADTLRMNRSGWVATGKGLPVVGEQCGICSCYINKDGPARRRALIERNKGRSR